jgi:hypothetical protein
VVVVVVVGLWIWFLVWFVACISELLLLPETCSCPWNNNSAILFVFWTLDGFYFCLLPLQPPSLKLSHHLMMMLLWV